MKRILAIIPAEARRRAFGATAALLGRALLNVIGVAALVPLLTLLLEPGALAGEGLTAAIRVRSGIGSERAFVAAVCGAAVVVTLLKGWANLRLARIEERGILEIYRSLSRQLFLASLDRGPDSGGESDAPSLARDINVTTRVFASGVVRPAATMLADAFLLLLTGCALVLYRPAAAAALVVFLPAGWICIHRLRTRVARCGILENRARREKARIVTEALRGYADLALCGALPELIREFDRELSATVRIQSREAALRQLPQPMVETGMVAALALLATAEFGRSDSALLFGIFAMTALRLMPSVRSLLSNWALLRRNLPVVEILDRAGNPDNRDGNRSEPRTERSTPPLTFERTIEVRHLSFRYPGSSRDTIHDLSFTIRKGERLGICGVSGTGKSTLLQLLAGICEPTSGEIRIDGRRLTAADRRAWQNRIGHVGQHPFLCSGSLAANIAPGSRSGPIDRQRLDEVLHAVCLDEFVASLPQGIDTPLGTCGARLSGGQRQRIALARALYRQADILLLDEATSALDGPTEAGVLQALDELTARNPEITICTVAHHDTVLAGCSRLLRLGSRENTRRCGPSDAENPSFQPSWSTK